MANLRKARDIKLADKLDACPRLPFNGPLWRVAREGRDPLLGARSVSRWCTGAFDVLYASLERDGALAEIHALLASQPVFPSKLTFRVHTLTASVPAVLHLADLKQLAALGVEVARYRERDYHATQDIADAALFPRLRRPDRAERALVGANAVLFTDRVDPTALVLADTEPVNWAEWRKAHRGPGWMDAAHRVRRARARRVGNIPHPLLNLSHSSPPRPKKMRPPGKAGPTPLTLVPLREARCRALGSPGRGRRPRTCLARTHPGVPGHPPAGNRTGRRLHPETAAARVQTPQGGAAGNGAQSLSAPAGRSTEARASRRRRPGS